MTGIDVDALTEIGARAHYEAAYPETANWDALSERRKDSFRKPARVAVRAVAARVEQDHQDEFGVAELRERGLRVLGDEQCCELGCDGGACESCPCCCAGWCVFGRSGEIPERDLTPDSHYRIWIQEAAEHNQVAKLLAQVEGVDGVDYDEPARGGSDAN